MPYAPTRSAPGPGTIPAPGGNRGLGDRPLEGLQQRRPIVAYVAAALLRAWINAACHAETRWPERSGDGMHTAAGGMSGSMRF